MDWKRRFFQKVVIIVLLFAATVTSGCGTFISYIIAPRHEKRSVPAEYNLKADMLLILPYAGTDILFEYPTAAVEVSNGVAREVARNLGGKVKRIVNPALVLKFQESNLDWPSMSVAEIGQKFGADKVLYIELTRYTMMEPQSLNLLRGRIGAKVEVVDATKPADAGAVYSADVDAVFPQDRPVDILEFPERVVCQQTTRLFADKVVKKFYDHTEEVPIKVEGRR